MANVQYILEAKRAKQKIGGLLRSKKNSYKRHTEGYAKKYVEKMRKDIKSITGMSDSEYKKWMKDQLKARKLMKMGWSDYDLYLQAKLSKAREVSSEIQTRIDEGKFVDTRLHKTLDSPKLFSKKAVFTPEISNKAFFSLPENYEKGIKINGAENYSQYILLREMRSGQQADTLIYRHKVVGYDKQGNQLITPVRQGKEQGTTSLVMTKADVLRENYYKALAESLKGMGPDGVKLFNEIKDELDKLDKYEFETIVAFIPIPYIYEEAKVRSKYTQIANEIKDDIVRLKSRIKRG